MPDTEDGSFPKLLEMTTAIVASFVEGNKVSAQDLTSVIRTVHAALSEVAANKPPEPEVAAVARATPAQARKSISAAGLVSFEDGKTYQTLKRHLAKRGLTVAQYREKWGLPSDYPSTAPAYAEKRSALAKAIGLGRKPTPAPPAKGGAKKPAKKT